MRSLILFTIITLAMPEAAFSFVKTSRRDLKLITQEMIEKRSIPAAVVADVDRVLDDQATSDSVITSVTTFLAQPDVCRAVSVTPGGTTDDVPAGDVVFTGTNYWGRSITESVTLLANQSTIENGVKAFCTVTSIVFPVQDGAASTYDVGVIDVLGLHRCMDGDRVLMTVFDTAFEATRPTVVFDADEVEKNTVNIDGTLDGAKDTEVYFIQNFICLS